MNRARILTLCNKKGGPGKTTLTMNLAAELALRDHAVLVVDADPQQSAVQWSAVATEDQSLPFATVGYPQEQVHSTVRQVADRYEYILIDTPPSSLALSSITRSALLCADLVVVPVTPSPLDVWETLRISEVLAEINQLRESSGVTALVGRLVVNRLKPRTRLGTEIRRALEQIDFPVCGTMIREREIYKQAPLEGRSVHLTPASGSSRQAAIQEIQALTDELLEALDE